MGPGGRGGGGAAVLLIAAGLLWRGPGDSPRPHRTADPALGEGTGGKGPTPGDSTGALAPPAIAPVEPRGPSFKAESIPFTVTGRVVEETGRAIEGARISILPGDGEGSARTGPDGVCRLAVALPPMAGWRKRPETEYRVTLVVAAVGRETRALAVRVVAERELALGDIPLGPGGSIAGRVLDGEGAPVADAWVGLEATERAKGPVEERRLLGREILTHGVPAATDGTGGFLLEGVPAGTVHLWAGRTGYRAGRSDPVEVGAGTEARTDLRIETERPEDWVEGRVLAPDGTVLKDPLDFSAHIEAPGRLNTQKVDRGPDGRFRIPTAYQGTVTLLVKDPYRRWGASLAWPLHPGDRDVEMRFPAPRRVALSIRSRTGEPVISWRAHLTPAAVRFDSFFGVPPGEHHEGTAEFLAPGFPFKIEVSAPGFADRELGPFDPLTGPDAVECVLDPVAALEGRVLDGESPVPGARVAALSVVGAGSKATVDGLPLRWYPDPKAEARSGPEGAFTLPLKNAGRYVVRVEADGFAPAEAGPFDFDPAGGVSGIEIPLGRGGTLTGEVRMPAGRSPDGVIVALHRGDARPRSLRVGADGRYRFEGLLPGPWILQQYDRLVPARDGGAFGPGTSEFRWNCAVEEGRTVTRDLDLTGEGVAVLRGRLSVEGPGGAAGWTAGLLSPVDAIPDATYAAIPATATLGADGVFSIPAAAPGPWRVALGGPEGILRVFDAVELLPGENPWMLELPLGRVEGTVDASLAPFACVWEGEGGRWASAVVTAGADGKFAVPRMPAGRVRLVRRIPKVSTSWNDPRGWTVVREFEVPAGGVVRVE